MSTSAPDKLADITDPEQLQKMIRKLKKNNTKLENKCQQLTEESNTKIQELSNQLEEEKTKNSALNEMVQQFFEEKAASQEKDLNKDSSQDLKAEIEALKMKNKGLEDLLRNDQSNELQIEIESYKKIIQDLQKELSSKETANDTDELLKIMEEDKQKYEAELKEKDEEFNSIIAAFEKEKKFNNESYPSKT